MECGNNKANPNRIRCIPRGSTVMSVINTIHQRPEVISSCEETRIAAPMHPTNMQRGNLKNNGSAKRPIGTTLKGFPSKGPDFNSCGESESRLNSLPSGVIAEGLLLLFLDPSTIIIVPNCLFLLTSDSQLGGRTHGSAPTPNPNFPPIYCFLFSLNSQLPFFS